MRKNNPAPLGKFAGYTAPPKPKSPNGKPRRSMAPYVRREREPNEAVGPVVNLMALPVYNPAKHGGDGRVVRL